MNLYLLGILLQPFKRRLHLRILDRKKNLLKIQLVNLNLQRILRICRQAANVKKKKKIRGERGLFPLILVWLCPVLKITPLNNASLWSRVFFNRHCVSAVVSVHILPTVQWPMSRKKEKKSFELLKISYEMYGKLNKLKIMNNFGNYSGHIGHWTVW